MIGRIIFVITLSLLTLSFESCEPHKEGRVKFYARNGSNGNIFFRSFNNGFQTASLIELNSSETHFTGAGGILDVDSVLFIRKSDSDTILYRNASHGDDILILNHFFHYDNWIHEGNNKYFYNVRDEDFER